MKHKTKCCVRRPIGKNSERRAQKELETARKYSLEKFARELLPVVDNLERALQAVDPNDKAAKLLVEGVQLTHKSFIDVLKRFDVQPIDPLGEPFNPQLHQAMSMVNNPDVEPNTVVDVMQKRLPIAR